MKLHDLHEIWVGMTGWHEDQSIWQEGDQGQGRGWSLQTQEIGPPIFESIYIRFILSYCIIFIILIIIL